jgi:hypothetical protein
MDTSDILFRDRSKSWAYAVVGGLPYFLGNDYYGLCEDTFLARNDLGRISEDWIARASREHVRWIVSDSGETELNAVLDKARADGAVSTAIEFGQVKISRLDDAMLVRPGTGSK